MLTLFAIPKPFTDPHIAVIQRNAITSWTLLRPRPEIILFGDEAGTAAMCRELSLRHVPDVACNEFGTPLLNDLFTKAQRIATHDLIGYVNADIVLMSDFMPAIEQMQTWPRACVLAGAKRNVRLAELWDFDQVDWEQRLTALADKQYKKLGVEYIIFPRGFFADIPPLTIGRWAWDGWLLWKARAQGADLIDATPAVKAIHQDHGYAHIHTNGELPWLAGEATRDQELAGLRRFWFLREATHELTPDGPRRVRGQKLIYWCKTAVRDWLVYRMGPVRHALGLRRTSLRKIKHLFTSGVLGE